MCGKGAEPLGQDERDRLAGGRHKPRLRSSAERPGTVRSPPGPGLSQHLRLRGVVEKTGPPIGQFVRDCPVICYHNNPFWEAGRPGRRFPRPNPTV